MRHTHVQSLVIAATAGAAVMLWLWAAPAIGWPMHPAWLAPALGGLGASVLVGLSHHAWMGPSRRRWRNLHDRQDRLDVCQRELTCKVKLLELERQRLETIFNALGDAVLVTAADDTVQLVNDAAGRLLHLPAQCQTPCAVEQLIDDPRLVQLIREMRSETGAPVCRHLEHRVHRDNGETTIFDLTLASLGPVDAAAAAEAAPRVEPEGAGSVVVILRDVTQQRCVAEMHSGFVSSVSHELRTPLSSIKAYMEMLVDGEAQDEPTRQEFYSIIQAETNRLTRLIDNVLNISQIESGLAKVQRTLVDLHALAEQAVSLMRPQARAAGVSLQGPEGGEGCVVFADADMLRQALVNLLNNAVKYTPEGGTVQVALRVCAAAGRVEVSVRDTGLGIPEADVPFIFDKFYRVSAHRQLVKGTGLGLNLVKHVVETVHGGTLTLASRPGEGSTFTFRLALADKKKVGMEASGAGGDVASASQGQEPQPCFSGSTTRKDEK